MNPAGAAGAALHLDGAALDRVFPFHLAFDRRLVVTRAGPSLRRLLPALAAGCPLDEHFAVRRPNVTPTFEAIAAKEGTLFLLAALGREDLVLRGQMLPLPEQDAIAFLGSPWITDLDAMVRLGLKVGDYALHDPAADFLFLIQAQRRALDEAQALAGQLREARDDALRASRVKSEFLANMSHELRTPLNAVIGFSEIIRDGQMGPVDDTYRDYAGIIHESGQHLLDVITDILDFSKIEADRLELRESVVALDRVVAACHRILAERAKAAGVALRVELPPDLPPLRADERRLKQIVLNLLSNAVKFTPAGGTVTVTAALPESGGIVIAVSDTGIGMRPEEIPLALEPFRQIDGQLSRRHDGTGLGLPLARRLAEMHGGTLELESEAGAGTTVRIRLPAERVLPVPAPQPRHNDALTA